MQHIVVEETDICKTEICMIIYEKYEMQSFIFYLFIYLLHMDKKNIFFCDSQQKLLNKCIPVGSAFLACTEHFLFCKFSNKTVH